MPRGPGLNRNMLYTTGGTVASLVLTHTLAAPPADLCTVIYDCGVTAIVQTGGVISIAIKQGTPFLALDTGIADDPDVDEMRMDIDTIASQIPWLAWGAPGVALSIVVIVTTTLTSGTIFAVSEEVPVN